MVGEQCPTSRCFDSVEGVGRQRNLRPKSPCFCTGTQCPNELRGRETCDHLDPRLCDALLEYYRIINAFINLGHF